MTQQANQAAEEIYKKIKDEIFDFLLLPGDRFTETELAERYGTSRTPVRGALYRLKHEGYFEVQFRSGWRVRPFDFVHFDELYRAMKTLRYSVSVNYSQLPLDLRIVRHPHDTP